MRAHSKKIKIIKLTKKTITTMAEVMENATHHEKYATNAKANAGLTTGRG